MLLRKSKMIKADLFNLINRLQKDFPEKSPYIFGKRNVFGFDKLNLKSFEADEEVAIPDAMCLNEEMLALLTDSKTVFHIENYMAISRRPSTVGHAGVYRSMAIILMLSCVKYSFNDYTFPYINNVDINQMWADTEQMSKGDHVVCTILSVAMRGRGHIGFTRQHATRSPVPQVSVLGIPKFNTQIPSYQPPPQPLKKTDK